MCGIAGVIAPPDKLKQREPRIPQILAMLSHRGPDEGGIYRDVELFLLHARLRVIDPVGGKQPLSNEDGSLWLIINGEIFNYQELRLGLEKNHRFATQSDSEVLLHLYEDLGIEGCLARLNGQFAFALWDRKKQLLFLGRDYVGICPLYYSKTRTEFLFASEIKALLAAGISRTFQTEHLAEVFTFWCPLPGHTVFSGVNELQPGYYLRFNLPERQYDLHRYWDLPAPEMNAGDRLRRKRLQVAEELKERLFEATRLRLRADVPVGTYLSGGLDSSLVTALVKKISLKELHTFSLNFEVNGFDEFREQRAVREFLATNHHSFLCSNNLISEGLVRTLWHTETPLLRSAPVPLLALSHLVSTTPIKVILTGEGADEIFLGYNIFKETKIRLFWNRNPQSRWRPWLFSLLYPYLDLKKVPPAYLARFFGRGLTQTDRWDYSHRVRWDNGFRFLNLWSSPPAKDREILSSPLKESLPPDFTSWPPLARAQYLELKTFFASYLITSQGDRMIMAYGIEGRYPFLDRELIEFAWQIPLTWRLQGLQEKYILKETFADYLPKETIKRTKHPYRAPVLPAFFPNGKLSPMIEEYLNPTKLKLCGIFSEKKVRTLLQQLKGNNEKGEPWAMAFLAILSTQILFSLFVEDFENKGFTYVRYTPQFIKQQMQFPSSLPGVSYFSFLEKGV